MLNPLLIASVAIIFRILILINMNRSLPKIVDKMYKVDLLLKYDKNLTHQCNDTRFILTFTLILIILSFPFQIYSNFGHKTNSYTSTLLFATNIYNNYTTTCCEFQFITICYLLYRRFKFINGKLKYYNRFIVRHKISKYPNLI